MFKNNLTFQCRDIGNDSHEDIIKVLNELEKAMKRYHANHGESKVAEGKLRYVESQKQKVEQHASKGTLSRKLKSIEKQTEKVISFGILSFIKFSVTFELLYI